MQGLTQADEEVLTETFPMFAARIVDLCGMNLRLRELCNDFLVLQRNYARERRQADNIDEAYLADLVEGMEDLKQEIEALLRRMGVKEPAVDPKSPQERDTP